MVFIGVSRVCHCQSVRTINAFNLVGVDDKATKSHTGIKQNGEPQQKKLLQPEENTFYTADLD